MTALQQNWSNIDIVKLESISSYASNKMLSKLILNTAWGKNQNKTKDVEHQLVISSGDILKRNMVFHFNNGTHYSGGADVTLTILINGQQIYTKLITRSTDEAEDLLVSYNSVNITTAGTYTVTTRISYIDVSVNNAVQTFSSLFY